MKNINYRIMALLAASALTLTGCGNKDKGADDSDEVIVTVESTEETSEEATEDITADTTEDITAETTEAVTEDITEEDTTEAVSEARKPDKAQGSTDGLNILTALKTGLSTEETFAVTGYEYDSMDYTFKNEESYTWLLDKENVFGTGLSGDMFVEFDRNNNLLCFGYHLGGIKDGDNTIYPYSPEELDEAFSIIYSHLVAEYGEHDRADILDKDLGIREEKEWLIGDDSLWLMYGINLWVDGDQSDYENGINEIIVSMSAPNDYSYLN